MPEQRDQVNQTKGDCGIASRIWSALDYALVALAVLAAIAIFLNSLPGEFVYDDTRQILQNEFIMRNDLIGKALVSDVWAYKSGEGATSPYWRPVFVAWMIVNQRLFGFEPLFWHATNVFLHAIVTFLAFGAARRLTGSVWIAGAAALIFAVHPVHVESVTWISGSPDLLMAIGMFGGLWSYLSLRERPTAAKWIITILLTALAMGSKETGIVTPALYFAVEWAALPGTRWALRAVTAGLRTWPFFAIAGVYFIARMFVLQGAQVGSDLQHTLNSAVWTAPSVAMFYLRQLALPIDIGPAYPLRIVSMDNIGWMNVAVPVVVVAVVVACVWLIIRKRPHLLIPTALMVLPMLPAFNVAGLHPEQIVRDRYLYVSVLGFAIIAADLIIWAWHKARSERGVSAGQAGWLTIIIVSALLALKTFQYNPVWWTELSLWEAAVQMDNNSALNHNQHGVALYLDANERAPNSSIEQTRTRWVQAKNAFDMSLAITPNRYAYLGRSQVLIDLGKFDEAEADMRTLMTLLPKPDFDAYDRLAKIHEQKSDLRGAESVLREAREKIPYRFCTLTDKLAIVLYQQGRKNEALYELEQARSRVDDEPTPTAAQMVYRLGMLYWETGEREKARDALQEYLDRSKQHTDAVTASYRANALAKLGQSGL